MRPAGEISMALLQAVERLWTPGKGPTMREIAEAAGVGATVASQTIKDMRRYQRLSICGQRRVSGRNRPAAEYALPHQVAPASGANFGLTQALQIWG